MPVTSRVSRRKLKLLARPICTDHLIYLEQKGPNKGIYLSKILTLLSEGGSHASDLLL